MMNQTETTRQWTSEVREIYNGEWTRTRLFWAKTMTAGLVLWAASFLAVKAEKLVAPPKIFLERVETFTVKTRSEQNKEIPFYLRVPKNYQPGKVYRLLFLCPHLHQDGLKKLADSAAWLTLADERDWFVMSCTFKQAEGEGWQDRKLSYYYPESFSGKAMLEALELISKKYPVDTERLLMQGLSGGAQFVHRFAMWAPERVTAVAINSSSLHLTELRNSKCVTSR
jgi:poly(3-hydroxybutyrate) depolymerase